MIRAALFALAIICAGANVAHAQNKTVTGAWHNAYSHPTTFELQARSNMAVNEFMANHGLLGAPPTYNFITSTVNNIGNWFESHINASNSTVTISSGQQNSGLNQNGNANARTFLGTSGGLTTNDIVNFQ